MAISTKSKTRPSRKSRPVPDIAQTAAALVRQLSSVKPKGAGLVDIGELNDYLGMLQTIIPDVRDRLRREARRQHQTREYLLPKNP